MENLRVYSTAAAVAAALAMPGWLGSANAQTPNVSGTFWATEYHPKIQLVGGGELPLTAEGKAAYEKNMAGLKDGSITDNARKYCVPDGLPRVLATPYPFEIIQAPPGQITMVHELNHQIRVIAMDKPMPSEQELERLPVSITVTRSAISRAIRWWWRPPASTKKPSSTPPARRIPTKCAPRSGSARSARPSSRT